MRCKRTANSCAMLVQIGVIIATPFQISYVAAAQPCAVRLYAVGAGCSPLAGKEGPEI